MPDIAPQIETALAVMRLFDQIKELLPEGVAAIRHYPNATEEEKTKLHMLSYGVSLGHVGLIVTHQSVIKTTFLLYLAASGAISAG
jgi:hypothetical protein